MRPFLERTIISRSTASRRARNSASVTTARRRPASRPSRRRCFFASSRVEPLMRCGSVMSSTARWRGCCGSDGPDASSRPSPVRRRLRRRALVEDACSAAGSVLGQRRQRGDLGRVEEQLRRDGRDEHLGQQTEIDGRLRAGVLGGGLGLGLGRRRLGERSRLGAVGAVARMPPSVAPRRRLGSARRPRPQRGLGLAARPPRRSASVAALRVRGRGSASSVTSSGDSSAAVSSPAIASASGAPALPECLIRRGVRGVHRFHRPSLAYSLRTTPRVVRRNLVRCRTCGAAYSLGLQPARGSCCEGRSSPEVFW